MIFERAGSTMTSVGACAVWILALACGGMLSGCDMSWLPGQDSERESGPKREAESPAAEPKEPPANAAPERGAEAKPLDEESPPPEHDTATAAAGISAELDRDVRGAIAWLVLAMTADGANRETLLTSALPNWLDDGPDPTVDFVLEKLGARLAETHPGDEAPASASLRTIIDELTSKGASARDLVDHVRQLETLPRAERLARWIELLHAVRALARGARGHPAFGVENAWVCDAARWLDSVPPLRPPAPDWKPPGDDELVASLAACRADACPDLEGAASTASALDALSACRDDDSLSSMWPSPTVGPRIAAVYGLLAAEHVTATLRWFDRAEVPDQTLDVEDIALTTLQGWVAELELPILLDLGAERLPVSTAAIDPSAERPGGLVVADADGLRAGPWPGLRFRDDMWRGPGQLRTFDTDEPILIHDHEGRVDDVGIVLDATARVSVLRRALASARTGQIETLRLAARRAESEPGWLPLTSDPAALGDALVREDTDAVAIWIHPGQASQQGAALLPTTPDPSQHGQVFRVPAPESGLPAARLREALAHATVSRVILDPLDRRSTQDLVATIDALDTPRDGGADVAHRLELVVLTEHRTAALPPSGEIERDSDDGTTHDAESPSNPRSP